MVKGIIGKKVGMTQLFDESGKVIPVTVIEAGPCTVVQKKTVESDGYQAVQLGFGEVSAKKVNKAAAGHFKKANVAPKKTLREFRLDDVSAMNVGDILKADVFAAGDKVDVAGVSKGKGYQGVIKRFGQHRLRESHGTGPVARHAGSMGAISNPSRVFPGKRLPGHMGFVRVTVQNLTVVKVDTENNLIAVKGAVPGSKGTIVTLANSVKGVRRKATMAKFNVVDMNGQHVSKIQLSDAVFGITPNEKAVHIAVVNFLANQRQGTQNTKIRMEVSGGGKKPWRQKGTGQHARQGSIRAPQWTHGGVALGPKPRSYNYHINNKVKRLALLSVLSDKAANGNMVVVDKFACDEYKTKAVVAMLNAVGAGKKNLLVNETVDAKFVKSAGNIAGVKTTFAGSVNTYDVLNADKLIISVDAAKKLEEVLG